MTIELIVISTVYMDHEVRKITRRHSVASGYGFGQRDCIFEYNNYKTALVHAKKIKRLKDVDCVELRVEV